MLERPRTQPEINRFRRESLIAATLEVVAEKGLEKATIADICTVAGVSRGLANHYFDSKDMLLVAAYQSFYERLEADWSAATGAEPTAARKILATIYTTLSHEFFDAPVRAASLSFWSAALSTPALAEINREAYRRYHGAMTALFAQAARERGVAIDARAAAISTIATIDGLWLGLALNNGQFTAGEAYAVCRDQVARLLGALPGDPDLTATLGCAASKALGP